MYIEKVLKRKDAVSIIVSVVMAMIILQPLTALTTRLAQVLSGERISAVSAGANWQEQYLLPLVSALCQIVALEVLLRVYVFAHNMVKK